MGKISFFLGLVLLLFQVPFMMFAGPGEGLTFGALALPALAALVGIYLWGVASAWLFSAIASRTGGLYLDLEEQDPSDGAG